MESLTLNEIIKFTSGVERCSNNKDSVITNITINSKDANEGSLFIPIIGLVHDGHKFMEDAYLHGCRSFLCDINHDFNKDDINVIQVLDTTKAFGLIAKGYKEKFDIKTVGITGSVGKTSTKDIINSVLKTKYVTIKTEGNLNNEIGLPKTLFTITNDTQIGIIEMGMDKKGEIDYLSKLVNEDVAVITNIGMSHIGNFKNQEGIFDAKMEIVNGLKENGTLIVNGDDKFLRTLIDKKHDYDLITYGFNDYNDIYCREYNIKDESIDFTCIYENKEYSFEINTMAKHNIGNALVSIILGFMFGLTEKEISTGLAHIEFSSNRLDIIKTNKYTIINDCYNASYDSVVSAISVLNSFKTRKVAILGDILELGDYSKRIHEMLGRVITCDLLIAIGNDARLIKEEAEKRNIDSYYFKDKEDFYKEIDNLLDEGDTILVKASNGMKFNDITEKLQEK